MSEAMETLHGYVPPELYDAIYSWVRDDIEFYVAAARAAGGPVLELGCGTGRILLPSLEAGADIEGIDLHEGMLAELRRKAAARGLDPRVAPGDMREIRRARRFALVTIPFRTFLHNLTAADQLATLRGCREHLEPGGRLLFNAFHVSFEIAAARTNVTEPALERTLKDPSTGRHIEIWAHHAYDRVNQILEGDKQVRLLAERGAVTATHPHRFRLRWFYKAEMELLLAAAGFARWQVAGGFDGRPLEDDTDEMVWTAWKA